MLSCLVIADDLTGACDTGAVFAHHGFPTIVCLDRPNLLRPDGVVVVSTASRYLPESQAVRAVLEASVLLSAGADRPLIYKKIDSTLRGHVAAELLAVMRAFDLPRALVTPAFPAQGRVLRGGSVWVNGAPLEDTPFAKEVPNGSLLTMLSARADCQLLNLEQVRAGQEALSLLIERSTGTVIADAETDHDLLALARAGSQAAVRLWCGSAGLARALAGVLQVPASVPVRRLQGPSLVVAGSRHPATLAQITSLEQAGAAIFSVQGPELTSFTWEDLPAASARLLDGDTVVICAHNLPDLPAGEAKVAENLAQMAVNLLANTSPFPAQLVLTGGDTAAAVCRHLGCTQIQLLDELLPGLAWGTMIDGAAAGMHVITKAGGFGNPDALLAVTRVT